MLTDEEIIYLAERARMAYQERHGTAFSRNTIFKHKAEQRLMEIIREVVREYCEGFNHVLEEIIKKVRHHFYH